MIEAGTLLGVPKVTPRTGATLESTYPEVYKFGDQLHPHRTSKPRSPRKYSRRSCPPNMQKKVTAGYGTACILAVTSASSPVVPPRPESTPAYSEPKRARGNRPDTVGRKRRRSNNFLPDNLGRQSSKPRKRRFRSDSAHADRSGACTAPSCTLEVARRFPAWAWVSRKGAAGERRTLAFPLGFRLLSRSA
jgi:hypothetical protein